MSFHHKLAIVSCSLLTTLAGALPGNAMSELRWKSRPVVIFSPSDTDARLTTQRSIFAAARTGLVARDVVVMSVVGDTVKSEIGARSKLSAAALRKRYGVSANSFRAVLVGKDGGTKISSATALSAGEIFATIDAMPMRRQEMGRQR